MRGLLKKSVFFTSRKERIEKLIEAHLRPIRQQVVVQDSADSKFDIRVVSDEFKGKTILQRHKLVMDLLKNNGIMSEIHAVTLHLRDGDQDAGDKGK